MRVKFLQGIAGEHFSYRPKEIREIEDEAALKLIASGVAVAEPEDFETAVTPTPQNAARRTSKGR